MKTDSQTQKGSDTVRWLKSVFSPGKNKAEADTAHLAVATEANSPKTPRNGKTVLVVDDDPVFLKVVSMRLQSEGYDVITASEGSEAIQIARRNKPDILVLDVDLTRDVAGVPWDGFSVVTWLRRFDDLKNIPIVMATGGDTTIYTKKALTFGVAAFFPKRRDQQMLVALVSSSLQHPRLATAGLDTNFQI